MISICNILPNNCINENMPRQPYEMYLTHCILEEPQRYEFLARDTIRGIKSYKILDNSACELGRGLDLKDVLEAARIISADEIVLPDLPRKGNSLSYTLEYLLQVPDGLPYKLAGVIQGETEKEVLMCAEQLICLRSIDTIMLPKWYCQMNSTNGLGRIDITQKILTMCLKEARWPEIHWLGMDTGIREIMHSTSLAVRSIDTGYFAALSTPQWKHLSVAAERPRELRIDLKSMDVDMEHWQHLLQQQEKLIRTIERIPHHV